MHACGERAKREIVKGYLSSGIKEQDAGVGGVEVGGMQVVELLLSGRVPKVDAHVGAFDGCAVCVEGERVGGELSRLKSV